MSEAQEHPRKSPKQARSRATVTAIMQASTYILVEDGWARFTTNRVAERAGVNISSLYQYFPNKLAILEALRAAHVDETRRALLAAVAEAGAADPVGSMVRALIESHRVSPQLHRVLTEELPHSLRAGAECIDDPTLVQLVRGLFARAPDPALALFVARSAVHAVVHEATCHHPEMLSRSAFIAEVELVAKALLRRR